MSKTNISPTRSFWLFYVGCVQINSTYIYVSSHSFELDFLESDSLNDIWAIKATSKDKSVQANVS